MTPWLLKVVKAIRLGLLFIGCLWAIHGLTLVGLINPVGIIPRHLSGLAGVLLAPVLHANLGHLLANSIGILSFCIIFALVEADKMVTVFLGVYFSHGLLVWLVAREGNHLGASGLIFGLFGYLVFLGYFKRKIKYFLISAGVFMVYGGMFWGVLPLAPFVSWEGHLCGLITGAFLAKYA